MSTNSSGLLEQRLPVNAAFFVARDLGGAGAAGNDVEILVPKNLRHQRRKCRIAERRNGRIARVDGGEQ
jgi:hypothetical protein